MASQAYQQKATLSYFACQLLCAQVSHFHIRTWSVGDNILYSKCI